MFRIYLIVLLSGLSTLAFGQNEIYPVRIDSAPVIDGKLDEPMWEEISSADDYWQQFPLDSIRALAPTELRMAYDDEYIYVGVLCKSSGSDFIITSLKRDFSFRSQDNITLEFDTYADNTNAFVFGINAMGVRREALIANGGSQGREDFLMSWDNKWFGEAHIEGNSWSAEFAIPFKSIRYNEGSDVWYFNSYRNDTQNSERSVYSRIPNNRIIMDLNFPAKIVWDEPLQKAGPNISVIPYAIAQVSRDFEDNTQTKPNSKVNAGFDAKVGITSGLNLDLTANPDFSQVEVDQQVTNLDRFEIFFPERRQFFLENSDLFGSFGLSRMNPFFSRRIGVARDTTTGQNIQNPILYGARLSGKLNDNLRVGLLNMQTAAEEENGLPSFNYTVAAVQQKVFDRSNISFILVNKQAVNPAEFGGDFSNFNRIAGLEYRLASANNFWRGKLFYHHAFLDEKKDDPFTHGAQIEYQRRRYRLEWAHSVIGYGYDAEVGFVPRKDYALISPEFQLYFYPNKGILNTHSINVDTRWFYQLAKDGNTVVTAGENSEQQVEFTWEFNFLNTAGAEIAISRNYLKLLRDFDPTRVQADGVVLPAGSEYDYFEYSLSYMSDARKLFSFSVRPTFGGFFNGKRRGVNGSFNYRIQPYGSIGLGYDYNYIELASPFEPVSIWLVGPKFDLTFTRKLFLTAFFQYNNQLDNLNINTRLQWRFAPVSDFFLVYTDNYLTQDGFTNFQKRNHALVAKFTYWLNL